MEENTSYDEGLKVSLSTKDLLVYGITFMIPVAPLAFYGSFLTPANGMVALAYFVGMVAMLFTGFSYATMSRRYPFSGSVYTYVQQGTNAGLGFIGGWGITLDYFLIPTITYLISQSFGESLFPTVPGWAWIIILVIFNTIVNILGANVVTKISWVLFALQGIVLVAFIIGTIRLLLSGAIQPQTISFYNPQHFNIQGVLQATGIVIVSYLGFDAISTLSEEAEDPHRSVGRAIILSILSIGILFVIITVLAGFVAPDYQNLNQNTAFLGILQRVGGTWLVKLADITIILSFGFASGQEGQTAVSRILYAMGRDGILPPAFAKLHKKYRTPIFAIVLVGLASLILSLTLSQDTVSNLVSFGALFGFILLNLSVIWKFYVKGDHGSVFSKERVETKYYEDDTKIYLTLLKKQDILDLDLSRERVKKRVISNISTTGNTKYAEKLISKYYRDFDYVFDMVRAEQALPSKKDNFLKSISEPKPTPRFQIHKYDLVKLIDGRLAIVFSINDANTEYEVRVEKGSESWELITIKQIDIAHVYQHLDSFLSPTKISLSIKDVFFKHDVNFLIEEFPDINVETLCTDSEWFDLENKLEGLLLKYSQISNKQSHNIGIRIQQMLDIIPEKYVDVRLSSVVPPTLEEIDQLEELDVVKLKDGKFATIVFAPPHPYSWDMHFDFDIGDSSTSWATPITEIAEIIFFHSKNLPIHLNKMLTKEAIQNLHVLVPDFDVNKTLSKEEFTKLYDLIDHKLMTQGFDTNDEPTPIGLMAENLLTEFADI